MTAPRLGFTYDLTGNGKTVVKANYALYWWNPGTTAIDSLVNPNSPDWWRRYAWTDRNNDGVWQNGEQGAAPTSSNGGVGSTQLDPNLQDQRTREAAFWLEREVAANFGVHAGFVWRRIDQLYQSDNLNRPVSAFNVPITVRDPGPDGTQTATGTPIQAWNLNPANLALPIVNFLHNTPGKDDFYNVEFSANKRMSNKWSLNASYAYRWNRDNVDRLFRQHAARQAGCGEPERRDQHRQRPIRVRPVVGARSTAPIDAPWGLKVTPALRLQSGQPFARTFQVTMNYGTQRFLAEPIGSRQQDNIVLARYPSGEGVQGRKRPDAVGIRRRLQPEQHQRRPEHQLGFGGEFPAADDDHPAAALPLRREVRLVARNASGPGRRVTPPARAASLVSLRFRVPVSAPLLARFAVIHRPRPRG